jgi:predicted RNA-binding Zn ribbon-like protein
MVILKEATVQPTQKPRGELCLDFANTLEWHASDQPVETLLSYSDLIAWACKFEALSAYDANQLIEQAQDRAAESKSVLERGIKLREAIYRIIVANIEQRPPVADDLKCLNQENEISQCYWQISPSENGYQLEWIEDNRHLDRPLWYVVHSAVDLLISAELLSRVGQCADDRGCGWLFIDLSKNRSRRWCDINDCGNRAKQRRHYERSRKQQV